jgi:oligopeptide transport system substrate-binding protein
MPPLDDPKVRQAIMYAIDKDKLTSVVLKGMAAKADSVLPPGIPGFNETAPAPGYDPARAKQLLAESKYAGKAPSLTLTVGMAGAQAPPVIQAIQANLAANLGVTVDVQLVDGATFQTGLNQRKYAMFFTGWIADYPDPYDFLDILFSGQSGLNHMSYQSPQFDALVQAARVERDDGKRMQLYQQAEKILIEDAPAVPLFYGREYWLVKPYVKGVTRPPLILPWLAQVSAP